MLAAAYNHYRYPRRTRSVFKVTHPPVWQDKLVKGDVVYGYIGKDDTFIHPAKGAFHLYASNVQFVRYDILNDRGMWVPIPESLLA